MTTIFAKALVSHAFSCEDKAVAEARFELARVLLGTDAPSPRAIDALYGLYRQGQQQKQFIYADGFDYTLTEFAERIFKDLAHRISAFVQTDAGKSSAPSLVLSRDVMTQAQPCPA